MNRAMKVSAALLLAIMSVSPALAAGTMTKTTTVTKTVTVNKTPAKTPVKAPVKRVVTFRQLDANHDGKVSYLEMKKFFPKLTKKQFAAADTNKNGSLDRAEVVTFFKKGSK